MRDNCDRRSSSERCQFCFIPHDTRCEHVEARLSSGLMQVASMARAWSDPLMTVMHKPRSGTFAIADAYELSKPEFECWPKANPQFRYRPKST